MDEQLERLKLQFGEENLQRLKDTTVMVVGCGGVGSYAAEALARSGIGHLVLIDHDEVEITNLNRQMMATYDTLHTPKVEAMKKRIESYAKNCRVDIYQEFFTKEKTSLLQDVDFVVDAIDTITSKVDLYEICHQNKIPFISSMGMANRLDPTKIEVMDLSKTYNDPLARSVRNMVRKRNMKFKIPVVASTELPVKQNKVIHEEGKTRKQMIPPSSSIFTPATCGLVCASWVVQQILNETEEN